MAKSLGSLTLKLTADIGAFVRSFSNAEIVADQKMKAIERKSKQRMDAIKKTFIAGGIGTAIGVIFTKVISETMEFENKQKQLATVLKSTGQAAGYSQTALNKMATSLSQASTASTNQITEAQTALLAFTGIAGKEFKQASQAMIDMSARTGIAVKASAELIGRSLDVPSQGMSSLAKQGFRFSKSQIELAKYLEDTGRKAEAQSMILKELEESYGGAAAAARDTFGGSISGLKNALGDLMTGKKGSLDGAKDAINQLTATLSSDETKQAFSDMAGGIAKVVEWAVKGITQLTKFTKLVGEIGADIWMGDSKKGSIYKDANDKLKADENTSPVAISTILGFTKKLSKEERDNLIRVRDSALKAYNEVIAKKNEVKKVDENIPKQKTISLNINKELANIKAKQAAQKAYAAAQAKAQAQAKRAVEALEKNYRDTLTSLQDQTAQAQTSLDNLAKYGFDVAYSEADKLSKLINGDKFLKLDDTKKKELMQAAESLDKAKKAQAVTQFSVDNSKQLEDMQFETSLIGKQREEIERLTMARQLDEQAKQLKAGMTDTNAIAGVDSITAQAMKDYDKQQAERKQNQEKYNNDLFGGMQDGFNQFVDSVGTAREAMAQAVGGTMDKMADGITEFVMTGKLNFKEFTRSILADLAKILIRQALVKGIGMVASAWGGGTDHIGNMISANGWAKGGAFSSDSLSQYRNQVHSSPKMFEFAKGGSPKNLGVFGEAGAEAIMPLRRGRDGNLGVRADLSGVQPNSGGVQVNLTVNTNIAKGQEQTSTQKSGDENQMINRFAEQMKNLVKTGIQEETRQGGLLWRMQHG